MAGTVCFRVTISLDGFIAPEERMDDPDVQRWTAQRMELRSRCFRNSSSATVLPGLGDEPLL